MQQIPTGIGSTGTFSTANRLVSVASSGVVKQSQEADAVTGGVLSFTATLTGNRALTLPDADTTITGGGTLALGGYTLTVPATGTAALLATLNVFTVTQTIDRGTANGALPTLISAANTLVLAQADSTANSVEGFGFGSGALLYRGRAIGGTRGTPAATAANQQFFNLTGSGYANGAYVTSSQVAILIRAGSLWSATNYETEHIFQGTPSGSTTLGEWLRLKAGASDPSGVLVVGTTLTTGNGLIQLLSGTTKASGIAWGTDCFVFRTGTTAMTIDAATAVTFTGGALSKHATAGVGYSTGAGGTVAQGTSRATGVTLSKVTGQITLFNAAGSATPATFVVTNTACAATDNIVINDISGSTNVYFWKATPAAGSFTVTFWTTGGTASDTPIIQFSIIKGVTS